MASIPSTPLTKDSSSEEGSPLIFRGSEGGSNVLANAANELLRGTSRVDAPCLLAGRRVSLSGAFVLSASAKLGFIPISLTLPAGPLFAACNSLAFLNLEFWAAQAAIKEALGPKSLSERALMSRSALSIERKSFIILSSMVLSLVSQLPSGFAVYHYNSPDLRVPAAIVSVVANAFFPFRSMQLTFSEMLARQPQNEAEVTLLQVKKGLLSQIACYDNALMNGMHESGIELRPSNSNPSEEVYAYLARIRSFSEGISMPGDGCLDVSAKIVGVVLTILLEYALCMFTFESVKEQIVDEDTVAGVFAGAVVVSTLYLSAKSLVDTSKRITSLISRRQKTAIAQRMRPQLILGLNALGFAFDGLAIGPTYVIWGDFFEAYPKYGEKDFFQPVLCIAMFLLLYTATLELTDEGVESVLASRGSPQEKNEIREYRKLKRLAELIEKTSLDDFATFLRNAPNEYRETRHSSRTPESPSEEDLESFAELDEETA